MVLVMKQHAKDLMLLGFLLMLFIGFIRRKRYEYSLLKYVLCMMIIFFSGILGLYIMFYIENGIWGGISFFGTILIGPLIVLPFALLFKINFLEILDWCSPSVCIMHAMMKYSCYLSGCCGGNEAYLSMCSIPLQLMEVICVIVIMVVLLFMERKNKTIIYPTYLLIYGIVRLILNSFRANLAVFYILPAGHVWSIVSILVAIILLVFINKRKKAE